MIGGALVMTSFMVMPEIRMERNPRSINWRLWKYARPWPSILVLCPGMEGFWGPEFSPR